MKLLGDFCHIVQQEKTEGAHRIQLHLQADHVIFTGHFPGYPVTPAAIQVQMVRELMEGILGQKLQLERISQSKFLQVLNPIETPEFEWLLKIQEEEAAFQVKAIAQAGKLIFCKITASFQAK